ncbi:glycerophosphodiester phosphodiesterase family protein [Teredinibacter turnerae]|uniref:glycerophosphodiester phosphodiesterase family protein n=1 Tax=Teredinibacter turnerae TaxID=2426 RepID=UPI000423B235|nr:glycerophosphodiester phosphodiesterase family protein [Teredinibacter turnerae]
MSKPDWKTVGHRGYPSRFPENTLPGFIAAIEAGVEAVEFDIQMSRDGIPVVFHDDTLERTTTAIGALKELDFAELQNISCHYPQQFRESFSPLPIQSLAELSQALASYSVEFFIEIKEDCLPRIGPNQFLEKVLQASAPLGDRRRIISFDYDLLVLAKNTCNLPIGWCLPDTATETLQKARDLQPDLLIAEPLNFIEGDLWQGAWQWFIYNINTHQEAQRWAVDGATYIETNFVHEIIKRG